MSIAANNGFQKETKSIPMIINQLVAAGIISKKRCSMRSLLFGVCREKWNFIFFVISGAGLSFLKKQVKNILFGYYLHAKKASRCRIEIVKPAVLRVIKNGAVSLNLKEWSEIRVKLPLYP